MNIIRVAAAQSVSIFHKFIYLFVLFQDNVVCLPKKMAASLGNINPICVCFKVTQTVHVIDPNTCQGKHRMVYLANS